MLNKLIDALGLDNKNPKPWHVDNPDYNLGIQDANYGRQPCSNDERYMWGYNLTKKKIERKWNWLERWFGVK